MSSYKFLEQEKYLELQIQKLSTEIDKNQEEIQWELIELRKLVEEK